jgi:hypothetical protein
LLFFFDSIHSIDGLFKQVTEDEAEHFLKTAAEKRRAEFTFDEEEEDALEEEDEEENLRFLDGINNDEFEQNHWKIMENVIPIIMPMIKIVKLYIDNGDDTT